MCSIVTGFNLERVKELTKLNEYRGTYSHSITVFAPQASDTDGHTLDIMGVVFQHKALGALNFDDHDIPPGFIVCHQQAPTTDDTSASRIHPCEVHFPLTDSIHMLWHNGIIKPKEVNRLVKEMWIESTWDTRLILAQMMKDGTPDNIDGSFSCVWYNGAQLFFFRNEISPMFIDQAALESSASDIIMSSTKFDGCSAMPANQVVLLDLVKYNPSMQCVGTFTTKENPFYFG